jgi:hypothetical protein
LHDELASLHGLLLGLLKEGDRWELHIAPIREMIILAIKKVRDHLQDPDEDGRRVFRWILK